ncbi:hypothetical protein F53441_507 [Fusarium austroafricanum]|uniref:Uncharacterized protein n=1 Tax=Fusarium austroafricanum TaxID=2364996 RepID=A0A8H4PED1_9HYPO|nr:hypothetical protein F53441_507 [Fusarium austroafricanum]
MVQYYQRLSVRAKKQPESTNVLVHSSQKVEFSPRVRRSQAAPRNIPSRPETLSRVPREGKEVSDTAQMLEDLGLDREIPNYSSSPLSSLSSHSPLSGEPAKNYQIEDEQIVNTALVLFLNALTLHCDLVQGEWTLYRQPFVVKDATKKKAYEARVDGLFRINGKGTRAIVEVKPFVRNASAATLDGVRMQETAQMAAWIAQHPPLPTKSNTFTRLLVSQDRGEVYLIIADFNLQYVECICAPGRNGDKPSFLEMNEYGPFFVEDPDHMKQLGTILLAVSIQGGL